MQPLSSPTVEQGLHCSVHMSRISVHGRTKQRCRTDSNGSRYERMFYTGAWPAPQYLEDICKTALNRVPAESRVPFRWTINPYRGCTHSCHYCFARAFHTYLDLGIGDDFSSKIVVKTNVVEVLRRELASPRWDGEAVAMGTATDPYQHCEGRYRLTRGVVETLADFAQPALDADEVDDDRPRPRRLPAAERGRAGLGGDERRHARRGRAPCGRARDAAGPEAPRDPRPLLRGRHPDRGPRRSDPARPDRHRGAPRHRARGVRRGRRRLRGRPSSSTCARRSASTSCRG